MSEIFWYRLLFKLKLYEVEGTSFQTLVSSVFLEQYKDFRSISPWGNKGDGGNDGYVPSHNYYLQVYGPNARSNWDPHRAAQKAATDFIKLKKNWPKLQRYSFVLNDRFVGIPAPVEQTLQTIQEEHKIETDSVGCGNLTNMFNDFTNEIKEGIVGGIPDDQPPIIDPRAVGELLDYLAQKSMSIVKRSKRLAPDFEEKLKFNGLSDIICSRIRANSYQSDSVTSFLKLSDQWLAQSIAEELHALYEKSRETIDDVEEAADVRYVWMMKKIVPDSAKNPYKRKALEGAAELVLAYFFESCDVYDKPTLSSSTA
ncbi:ABC-three component system protein [Aristophania vespae]|uniref:ABC-three component system protein n=1 Tax=Aristophania vespae TaxID=2697033 RepID=UPI0023515E1D|nr:ABC-three component system protein [Aristophania vespae]UMM63120.1 hypothetical protein DM15PD_00740 [Aristophania vespae]